MPSAEDDLKAHALSNTHDFYALLSLAPSASESEIRTAYRKTALKYHPDKNAGKPDVIEKFHLLQIAYDVLSDAAVKELYDNARRTREEKKEREQAFEGRRKWMKEDLERRESGAFKRKRDEVDEEAKFERELRRLAEDGKRRRREREEEFRREVQASEAEAKDENEVEVPTDSNAIPEVDRSIALRFPVNASTQHLADEQTLTALFSRFGDVEAMVLKEKKLKPEGSKHRIPYNTGVIVFKSIVGAHAAISDFPTLQQRSTEGLCEIEQIAWASGKEPDGIPKPPLAQTRVQIPMTQPNMRKTTAQPGLADAASPGLPTTPIRNISGNSHLKKVPSFASFRGTPRGTPGGGGGGGGSVGTPSSEEITMMRLKNAEKRRLEEKIRLEELEMEGSCGGE